MSKAPRWPAVAVLLAPLFVAVGPLVAPGAAALPAAATATGVSCPAPTPTLVGTSGNDRLVGTPGRDVIAAGAGDDVVLGLGGDDVLLGQQGRDVLVGGRGADRLAGGSEVDIVRGDGGGDTLCGDEGADVLLGAAGDDVLAGGNGPDLVSGSFGDDLVVADLGDDVVGGGPGDDRIDAGPGDDRVGGGPGRDDVVGGHGDDRLLGSDPADTVAAGPGTDVCTALSESCESTGAPQPLDAALGEPEPDPAGHSIGVPWSATAAAGARLVELYADDVLVAQQSVHGSAVQGRFTVPVADLATSAPALFLVVTDADGQQAGSDARQVRLSAGQAALLQPRAALVLAEPLPIGDLSQHLDALGLDAVEYRAADVAASAPAPDPEIVAAIGSGGAEPFMSPKAQVLYSPAGTPAAVHDDELRAYYQRQGITGEPMISSVTLLGPLSDADLGSLATRGTITGNSAPPATVEPEAALSSTDAPTTTRPRRAAAKSGRTAGHGLAAQTQTAVASADAPAEPGSSASASTSEPVLAQVSAPTAYWPVYGRFDVDTYDGERWGIVCGRFICLPGKVPQPKAELQHQLVFTHDVLAGFAERHEAYEHNVTVQHEGRIGKWPACNPFSNDEFYVGHQTATFTKAFVPDAAQIYHDDVVSTDPCSRNEVTFGFALPEHLADDVPTDRLPVYDIRQESNRRDDQDRWFSLTTQALDRTDLGCEHVPGPLKKYCIGLFSGTREAILAKSGGTALPGLLLPTCTTWRWTDLASDSGPDAVARCSADRDRDGFDDTIDCAPDDPARNPGAVDVPNDGIDQNCDGADLRVGDGAIRVTLTWDNDNDQDLHLVEPGGREIAYYSPGPTPTGGRLDRDDNVGVCGRDSEPGGVENIYYPQDTRPGSGTYRVDVVQYESCGRPAAWTARVYVGGNLIMERSGNGGGAFSFDYAYA